MVTKIKGFLNSVLNWFLLSSADPTEASLTFKGLLVAAVPTLMTVFGLTHIAVSQDMLSTVINDAATTLQDVLYVVAALMTVWGAFRKLVISAYNVWHALVIG